MENTVFLTTCYNGYGFGLRSQGTFWRQRASKGLDISEADQRPSFSHTYLMTSGYCSSKSNIYYFCFTASMQTTYKKRLAEGWC